MKSILRLSTVLLVASLSTFTSCQKESKIEPKIADNQINNSGNNTNLTPAEANMVGTWVATEFAIDCYDEDTVYLQTWNNYQGYKNRTLELKNDFSYNIVDSFNIGGILKYQGKWKLQNGFLELDGYDYGKGKMNIKSQDNFETSVGYFYRDFTCTVNGSTTHVDGYQMYRYNYIRK